MSKMQDLIKESYKLAKAGNLIGICYSSCASTSFSQIQENKLDEFLEGPIEMLYLKSIVTDTDIQIYEYELKDFKVKHSEEVLYILTNKGETRLMY